MTTVQGADIFSSPAIAGFDWIMFAGAAVMALAAWHPEVMGYLRRGDSMPGADEIRARPLQWRTLMIAMTGAPFAAGILTAIAPGSPLVLVFVALFIGAATAASVWTALRLVPLSRGLSDLELPGVAGTMLRRMGRHPLSRIRKVLAWSATCGGAVGAGVVLYRAIRTGDSTKALPIVMLCTIGTAASGYVLFLAGWAGSVGEYARTGVVPPNLAVISARSPVDTNEQSDADV